MLQYRIFLNGLSLFPEAISSSISFALMTISPLHGQSSPLGNFNLRNAMYPSASY